MGLYILDYFNLDFRLKEKDTILSFIQYPHRQIPKIGLILRLIFHLVHYYLIKAKFNLNSRRIIFFNLAR